MTLAYDTYSEARAHFKDLLDAAESGRPALVRRDGRPSAVVDATRLCGLLSESLRLRGEVVSEAGGWSVFIPGTPVAADGATLDEAIDEMILALREYAADWQDSLLNSPNHRGNWGLVQFTSLCDDEQLRRWLLGTAA
ncbi:MAG TPA: type II toxin-antitoxin system prevent-host-death family antitoxin [Acidimicrobiales bacterium]|nr:type II toxin-antitoxin system prevent-host-death family antitoxin [Acidimicrobiales bacterium]